MKKIITLCLALVLLTIGLAGCGTTANTAAQTPAKDASGKTILKVGATPVPHAEILNFVKPMLAKEGIDLQIQEFNDYVQPNLALDSGELDANFFQHIPYLDTFNQEKHTHLTYIAKVHIEPMGVYSNKVKSLNDLAAGSTIVIPNDPSQVGRSLLLLQKAGLITLKNGVGINGTELDIVSNPKNIKIKELEAAQLPRVLNDAQVGAAVINTNFALEAKLNPLKDAIFLEDKNSPYVNVLAVRDDDKNNPALQKLAQALTSPQVKKFIEDKYKGSIIPAF